MNILVTGGSGFVGGAIAAEIARRENMRLTCAVRRSGSAPGGSEVLVKELGPHADWSDAVRNQDVVVHAAARAHVMKESVNDPLKEYRRVNVDGTLQLARQAAEAGVRRFVFISSIKVNGETSAAGRPFTANDIPDPAGPYGVSKMEAEQGLSEVSRETGMEVVVIRPPLVYGRGVKGNFATMAKLVRRGFPLPLGSVRNRRTLVSVENLVDFTLACITHPAAANEVFLVGDGQDLSTTELLRAIAKAVGKPARLIPVPSALLMLAANVLGKKNAAQRVLGSLQSDISKARQVLGWEPPLSVEEGLHRCFVAECTC